MQIGPKSGGAAVAAALALAAGAADAHPPGRVLARAMLDPTVRVLAAGRTVEVAGTVTCPGCRRLVIGFTATQPGTGAVSVAASRCTCARMTRWRVRGRLLTGPPFAAGPVRVCAWAVAYPKATQPAVTRQWCRTARAVTGGST